MANNEFLVSVANAVGRDPNTGEALLFGTTNIDSALTMTMAETEVRGGINNPLLYVYKHDKKVDVKVTNAVFDKKILALNAGTTVLNSSVTVLATDCLDLSVSGSATLLHTPTSTTGTIFLNNGTTYVATFVGSTVTYVAGASQSVKVVYTYAATADRITIETTKPPTVLDMTLIAEVRDNTGVITNYLQINIPRYQVNGNYTLSMTANGVSNQAIEGSALAVSSTNCTSGDYYATVTWIPVSSTSIPVTDIAVSPATWTFSVVGVPKTKQVTLYGLRGGLYSNVVLTTSASFAVTSGSASAGGYSVGLHTGLITAGSAVVAGWLATVTASYIDATAGTLNDTITIIATA